MKRLLSIILGGVAVAAIPNGAEAKANFVSRYTSLEGCSEVEHPPQGQDWVYFRCRGFANIPVWYTCADSVHCDYGFGAQANVSGWFGISRKDSWPIEWRGVSRNGRFEPIAVISRLPSADPDAAVRDALIVFRLRSDGTSCIIGETSSNLKARVIADRSVGGFRCLQEYEHLIISSPTTLH